MNQITTLAFITIVSVIITGTAFYVGRIVLGLDPQSRALKQRRADLRRDQAIIEDPTSTPTQKAEAHRRVLDDLLTTLAPISDPATTEDEKQAAHRQALDDLVDRLNLNQPPRHGR